MIKLAFWKRLYSSLLRNSALRTDHPAQTPAAGKLYLVSAGIGDPDNLTIKAHNVLRRAEVIFISAHQRDRLAELLAGKELHDPSHGLFSPIQRRHMPGEQADELEQHTQTVIRNAIAAGKTVAIVDYGDPMIYGPQQGYLRAFRDLHPEVIPGISSFNAANAALATVLTGGKHSESVILTLAKAARDDYDGNDSLAKLAATRSTMALFTMKLDLPKVVQQLKTHYPGNTPVAIVLYAGEAERQQVVRATLDTIAARTLDMNLPFEHLIYVGDFLDD